MWFWEIIDKIQTVKSLTSKNAEFICRERKAWEDTFKTIIKSEQKKKWFLIWEYLNKIQSGRIRSKFFWWKGRNKRKLWCLMSFLI